MLNPVFNQWVRGWGGVITNDHSNLHPISSTLASTSTFFTELKMWQRMLAHIHVWLHMFTECSHASLTRKPITRVITRVITTEWDVCVYMYTRSLWYCTAAGFMTDKTTLSGSRMNDSYQLLSHAASRYILVVDLTVHHKWLKACFNYTMHVHMSSDVIQMLHDLRKSCHVKK